MITEEQEDQAALYAMGLLDADAAAAFEREMAADGELRKLVEELRETVTSLARTDTHVVPQPELKVRVLAHVAQESQGRHLASGKIVAGPMQGWLPWAIAAAVALYCGKLQFDQRSLEKRNLLLFGEYKRLTRLNEHADADPFRQVVFCSLEPVAEAQQTGPQAAVLWDTARRRGKLHLTKLPIAGEGKDYQLWAVETGVKDPVSAGVVKVGPNDSAEVDFQPDGDDGKAQVVAFALSRERAGGVPKGEGPILFLGKLSP